MRASVQYSLSSWGESKVSSCIHRSIGRCSLTLCSISNANETSTGPKAEYDFSKTQPWVRTAQNLTFLDETRDLRSFYDHDNDDAGNESPFGVVAAAGSSAREKTSTFEVSRVVTLAEERQTSTTSAIPRSYTDFIDPSVSANSTNGTFSPTKRRRLTTSTSYEHSPASASAGTGSFDIHASPSNLWQTSPHTGWTPSVSHDLPEGLNFETPAPNGLEHTTTQENQAPFTTVSESLSCIYLEESAWPLSDPEEARLLRYFVEKLSRNFDLTDPLRHYRTVVPQRAATCPTLLNAILALSSRHLSRTGQYDPLVSNKYHQECLKHLIPMLDDAQAVLDENLLASTIILRHLEEIEVPLSGLSPSDQQSHLLGANIFLTAQVRSTFEGGLREAAFWVGLRQEIYVAFVNQRSIIPELGYCNIDRSLEAAPDHIWACRIVVLCADVIRYCFGEGDPATSMYNFLATSVAQWFECKPASWTPVYYRAAGEDEVFPEIWYMGDDIIVGMDHYHIARILLSAHNPKMPRLGPNRTAAIKATDEEIREHVKMLCGICLSNSELAPSWT